MSARWRKWGWPLVAGLEAALIVYLIAYINDDDYPEVEENGVYSSVSGDVVTAVSFQSEQFQFTAQRSRTDVPFAVQITFADGRSPQYCMANRQLDAQLEEMFEVREKQEITVQEFEKHFTKVVGLIDIKTGYYIEPTNLMELHTTPDSKRMAVMSYGHAVEINKMAEQYNRLIDACTI